MVDKKTRILVTVFTGVVLVLSVSLMFTGLGSILSVLQVLAAGGSPDAYSVIVSLTVLALTIIAVVFSAMMLSDVIRALRGGQSAAGEKKHFGALCYIAIAGGILAVLSLVGIVMNMAWLAEYSSIFDGYLDVYLAVVSGVTSLLMAAAITVFSIILINIEKKIA